MERDFKGIWIPKDIWLDKELSTNEKLFFVEIDSLDGDDGCYASNDYFSEFFNLSKNRCSEIIRSLEQKGLIKINYIYKTGTKMIEKRVIKCIRIIDSGYSNYRQGVFEISTGYSENCEDNNTIINNTNNNNNNIPPNKNNIQKHKFGEYKNVLLKDEELNKLNTEYGEEKTGQAIKYLDEYIEMKGYKAKSHYLCIRKWVIDAVNKENKKGGTVIGESKRDAKQSEKSLYELAIEQGYKPKDRGPLPFM